MTIREATRADLPHIVVMGLHFLRASEYTGKIQENPDAMFDLALRLIESVDGIIFVDGDAKPTGMIGLHLYQHPMSGEVITSELFWWVEPDHRGSGMDLLKAAERWAKEHGSSSIQMIAPNDRVSRIYKARGYEKTEEHYQKVIT